MRKVPGLPRRCRVYIIINYNKKLYLKSFQISKKKIK